MRINLQNIKVRDVIEEYRDNGESGVVGYGGRLDIRPAYQREFIYKDAQRNEVINTVRKNFPLNTMYWVKSGNDKYELMDGQQRTVSICQYINGDFSIKFDGEHEEFFHNLKSEEQEQILNYELSIYICEGEEKERLNWFNIINIAGEKLTDQEVRNANYTGPWLSNAKRWFSKTGGPATAIAEKYINGSAIRQEYLETALKWIVNGDDITNYMSKHQHDENAGELWQYFQSVIDWVERTFPEYRKIMKGLDWGRLYKTHKEDALNAQTLEKRIVGLIDDEEIGNLRGIYEYLLAGNERALNLRTFDEKTKLRKYEKQKGICPICKKHFDFNEMDADHIIPWSKGGKTIYNNCQMLCRIDNQQKSGK
jgi:hypothetical protein